MVSHDCTGSPPAVPEPIERRRDRYRSIRLPQLLSHLRATGTSAKEDRNETVGGAPGPNKWTRLRSARLGSAQLGGGDPVIVRVADPAPVGQPLVAGNCLGASAAPLVFAVENPAEDARFKEWWRFAALVGFPHAAESRQHGDTG